ncbi:hypothetical protein [Salinisphaera sp. LB1]|uniref:hypothetical protein n=1 Tax=Salinisphaera sp. LB1 TaxID=2183911 RepID=UPI000D707D15|nr:hypothetical protein [Salinisphaera sp. LB1]AWN17687.1 hypothetical protein SALB1_3493 [Salinisphaera sp. LB1]
MATLYINTDQEATFGILKDQNGDPIEGATVRLTIIDKNNIAVDPQPSPFPMTFVDQGSGNYIADIPHDHELDEKKYLAQYIAVKSGVQSEWHGSLDVVYRSI